MNWSGVAAILLGLAVMLGAFGAHGLRARLDAYSMGIYEKAVFYHFIHALGLLVVSILPKLGALRPSAGAWVCWLLALTGVRTLGAVTPLGGLAFIAAWFALAWALFRN